MATGEPTLRSGIYQIRHIASGRVYVGSAIDIKARWAAHRCDLGKGIHHSARLQNAWNKHGSSAFAFEVLECVIEPGHLIEREQCHIDHLRASDPSRGYNIFPNARSALGCKRGPLSAETRAKLSAVRRGKKPNLGNKHSPESRAKISAALLGNEHTRGYVATPETRAKLSEALKGNKNSLGHVADAEHRARLSAALKGRAKTPEHRAKIAETLKGRTFSAEHRANISSARRRRAGETQGVFAFEDQDQ